MSTSIDAPIAHGEQELPFTQSPIRAKLDSKKLAAQELIRQATTIIKENNEDRIDPEQAAATVLLNDLDQLRRGQELTFEAIADTLDMAIMEGLDRFTRAQLEGQVYVPAMNAHQASLAN